METKNISEQQELAKEILIDLADQLLATMARDKFCMTDHGLKVFVQRLRLANALLDD